MSDINLDYIIPPVDRALLKAELTPERYVRKTNKIGNLIYIVKGKDVRHIAIEQLEQEAFASDR